jgi:hypothetical protein
MIQCSCGLFRMKQNVWVSPRHGVEHLIHKNQWKVQGESRKPGIFGLYDAIVIAHNGKCADQLMSLTPCMQISDLLKVQFEYKLLKDGGDCMTLSSIYSLTFAIPANESLLSAVLPPTFWSGFIRSQPALCFLTCQTRKYPNHSDETGTKDTDPEYANAELPPPSSLESKVLNQRLQLCGARVPMNVWEVERGCTPAGFNYDGANWVGVCSDWLVEASIAGAWTSGRLLAGHMIKQSIKSHGYEGSFRRSVATAKAGIGMLQI